MLDEDVFWAIIDKSLKGSSDQKGQQEILIEEIEKLSPKQMIGFRLRTDKLLYDSYRSDLWCAGYIMNGGCSDDAFEYFRCWIISRGKETYLKAKANPDFLIQELTPNATAYDFEDFWYVARDAFRLKTGKDLYNWIDYDKFITHEGKYPKIEFTWQEDSPKSMKKICPNLYNKLWK
jgi:hypothetical protein